MAARMLKDTSGKFIGKAPDPENDWKAEPLVWERVGGDEPEPIAKVETPAPPEPQPEPIRTGTRAGVANGRHKTACKCGAPIEEGQKRCKACDAARKREARLKRSGWVSSLTREDVE